MLISTIGRAQESNRISISNFASEQLNNWQTKSFKGQTQYTLTRLDNYPVLKAESDNSASGLFKEQRIDLLKTPYLNWNWRIDNRLGKLNEQHKSGDDYAARVYVVISGGWAFWKTRAVNYVWANNSQKGDTWANAFAGKNAMMVAVRSSGDKTKQWYTEKRNVLEDLEKFYGEPIRYIDAVAIMTDTDNAKGKATAYYGDIFFSSN
jgi:hypothetical protein